MTPLRFGLFLTYWFLGGIAQAATLKWSRYLHQESGFVSANVGDSVVMRCSYEGNAVMYYWYKQTLGQRPRLISSYYTYEKTGVLHNEFNNSRFILDTGNGKNQLSITDLRTSDSATYYCASSYAYMFEFAEGTTVSVKGSGLNIPALVYQSASETIQPGDSVTLNCTVHTGTCDGEHSVSWFTNSEESHPGLIYTHGGRNDQCLRKPTTQTHTCVYNLPVKSLNLSHAGIFYCAVASCGHMLFGEEKRLNLAQKVDSFVLVYFLIGALVFTTILIVLLAYATYRMNNRNSCQYTGSRSSAALTPSTEDYQDSDNLHYSVLREHKVKRSTRQRDDTQTECVYSSVRQ